jgi:NADPH:quinone reductase-like Zn-dependent oxidoreductase
MKACVLEKSTKVSDLKLSNIEIPKVKDDWVLVKVMAFGLNHSEALFRQFEIDNPNFQKPIVPGIECVGLIENPSNTNLKKGDKVIALMGGMGRTFNGSYEEYALIPKNNVFKVNNTKLDWIHLAAIPETYFTAWGSLFTSLKLKPSDTLLIRGGTSALGIASIILAKNLGCQVYATARNNKHNEFLTYLGVDKIIIDENNCLKDKLDDKVDKILELVGPLTIRESLKLLKVGGICCVTGILGNVFTLDKFDSIKEIPNGCYLTGFYSNYPTQEVIDEMMSFIEDYSIIPEIGQVYSFDNIKKYSEDLETGHTNGKGIVVVDEELKKFISDWRNISERKIS